MLLSKLYGGNATKYKSTKSNPNNRVFFNNKKYGGKFYFLNWVNPPTPEAIRVAQKTQTFKMQKDFKTMKNVNNWLKADIESGGITQTFNPLPIIQKIEDSFGFDEGGLGYLSSQKNIPVEQKLIGNINNKFTKYTNLVNELQNIYNFFNDRNMLNDKTVSSRLKKLQDTINELKIDIQSLATDPTGSYKVPPNRGYLKNLYWIGLQLKGRLLEQYGYEFLNNVVPSNIKIVDTSQILGYHYDVFGQVRSGSKALDTDLMAFDKGLTKTVNISYTISAITGKDKNGHNIYSPKETKTVTLEQFLNKVQSLRADEQITIIDPLSQQNMYSALISGIQAKSGKGQIRFNSFKPSEVSAKAADSVYGLALRQLQALFMPPYSSTRLKPAYQPYNKPLFDYCLSRCLTQVIGSTNDIMLTRDGFSTTSQWLYDQINLYDKYIQAVSSVNLSLDNPVQIALK